MDNLLRDQMCPDWLLSSVSSHGNLVQRRLVAANPATSIIDLIRLLRDPALTVAVTAANRIPAVIPLVVDNPFVRAVHAANPDGYYLERYATDKAAFVRAAAAGNPAAPQEVLNVLAFDRKESVRAAAARLVRDPSVHDKLVRDTPRVRRELATNPSLRRPVAMVLARDADLDVRARLAANTSLAGPTAVLASDHNERVRQELARHARLTDRTFELLIADIPAVRLALARNPTLSDAHLERLTHDPDVWVRLDLAGRPAPPPWLIESLAVDTNPGVRAAIAGLDDVPRALLIGLAGDPDWSVRRAVTENPRTDRRTLLGLCADPNPEVRRFATGRNVGRAGQALAALGGIPTIALYR